MADRPPARWDPSVVLGPERLAGLLSVLVVAAIVAAASRPAGPADGGPPPAPTATPSVRPSATTLVSPALLDAIDVVHSRLVATGEALEQELLATQLETPEIATLLRNLNPNARFGIETADRLAATPRAAALAGELRALYEELTAIAGRALGAALSNTGAYRDAAAEIIVALERLPDFDVRLDALRGPGPEPTPTPSVSASASVTSPSAAPTKAPGEILDNASFEEGVGVAWELHVESGSAELVADADGFDGLIAARVDIGTPTDARSGISLRQGGVQLSAGTRYVASVALRASIPREVRVRVASADGKVYGTRLFSVGTGWQVYTFDFLPFESDSAFFELALGGSSASVSVDAASLRVGSAVGP